MASLTYPGTYLDDLFRLADQQLYAAKQRGRDRVAILGVGSGGALAAA